MRELQFSNWARLPFTENRSRMAVTETGSNDLVASCDLIQQGEPGQFSIQLQYLWTAPNHRREGLGTALVTKALEFGRFLGADSCIVAARPNNEAAKALYKKLGFCYVNTSGPNGELWFVKPIGTEAL